MKREGIKHNYLSMARNAEGSTSGTSISSLHSASPPWNMAWKTELPMAKTYLCAGITWTCPGGPTTNRTSAIRSLLNMRALRSRTVDLLACQLGSRVADGPRGETHGLDGGVPGALTGCIICRLSRCEMM